MRKCLLLVTLLLSVAPFGLRAQSNLFDLETDTLCVGQPLRIVPRAMNATSYYWGFCSGYLLNTPLMDNLGAGFGLNNASSIEIARDGNNFYGFVVNEATTELLRLSFGNSLANTPTITNFGNLDLSVSPSPNSLFLTQDSGKWFLFICGGRNQPSSISRIDFGNNLGNVPNGVRMGNPGGLLNDPRGIFVAKQGTQYYGFVVNAGNNRLVRLNFGDNISRTPSAQNVTTVSTGFPAAALNGPRDIAPIYDNGNWFFFVPNLTGNTISRLYFGNTLTNNPALTTVAGGGMSTTLNQPSSISFLKDCGNYYAYVTNRGNDRVLRYTVNALTSNWSFNQFFDPNGVFDAPADMSRILRDRDSLFSFVLNGTGNTLVRMIFPQCSQSSIASSSLPVPPEVRYDTPGLYNVYLAINEGQPNMNVDCKQVRVVQIPPITISRDTLICQGDTVRVEVASQFATGYSYSPDYNLSDTVGSRIFAYPAEKTTYFIRIPISNGCVVDTTLTIDVSRVSADAGPDRTIRDGASTVIGGPNTIRGPQYTYEWFPNQYIDNIFSLTPSVVPPSDLTYYLRVTNTDGCVDIDTVNVKVGCTELNLPNAFAPDNLTGTPNRFGLLNKQIVQLNYFRIFDRWGREVFTSTDVTRQWDGNVNGNPAPFGVYVWTADGFCSSGERLNKSGNVTLIR